MGVEPPFIYGHPSKYSFVGPSEKGFNPKAASEASRSPARGRAKVEGPLIHSKDFNRHPDSYFVVPYGNLNYKSMSPRTKLRVKWTRHTQLFLRICELLAAVGLLFCVICIKSTDSTTGWIIRIPPGIAILHTVYAVYHLARSSKGRTPSSSASYMLFAAIIDVGLIPFLVFTALISRTEYIDPVNTTGHWSTLFGTHEVTQKIVYSTFLISVVGGSLHLVSLIISMYLGVIFRKISRLPPDMNPLEDNLTSRHKRNKSSFLDKKAESAVSSNRDSRVDDPLISPPRMVPFMHTRNDSHEKFDADVSRLNSDSAVSQTALSSIPFYDQPPAHRSLQTNIKGPIYTQAPSNRSSRINVQSQHSDQPSSHVPSYSRSELQPTPLDQSDQRGVPTAGVARSPTKASSIYSTSTITTIATSRPASIRPRSTAPSLPDSNWITHPSPSPSPPRELKYLRNKQSAYKPLSQISPFEYSFNDENLLPKPLEMNPPTPPIQQQQRRQLIKQRTLSPGNGNVGKGGWGSGPGIVGIGKARAWGGGGSGRVVSRSGVDIRESGILPSGGIRAREVSGKVAEEGRGGSAD